MNVAVFVLQLLAAVLFGIAAFLLPADPVRGRIVAAGLLALTLSFLVGSYHSLG